MTSKDGSSGEEPEDAAEHLAELKEAFTSALIANGVLGKMKAQLRAAAVSLLRGDSSLTTAAIGDTFSTNTELETKVTLLLIHNFLVANHLSITAGIMESECSLGHCIDNEAREAVERLPAADCVLTSIVRGALRGGINPEIASFAPQEDTFPRESAASHSIAANQSGNASVSAEEPPYCPILTLALKEFDEVSLDYTDIDGTLDDLKLDQVQVLQAD